MDARLRELERRWKETGAEADRAAFLGARLRQGDLSADRLHLAAYLGDPVCRRLHEAPDEVSLPAALFEGAREAIEAEWRDALARPLAPSTRAVLAAAAELPQLRRLRPVTGSADTLSFSRCVESPYTPSPVILPVGADLPTTFLVQANALGEKFLGAPEDPAQAAALVADAIAPDQPVFRGSRHALHCARVEAGALDDPRDLDDWLSALRLWGSDAVIRALTALAERGLAIWEGSDREDRRPREAFEATIAYLRAPDDASKRAAIQATKRTVALATGLEDAALEWAVGQSLSCWRALDGRLGDQVYGWPPDHVLPDAELKDAVRFALVPWALGEGDPLLE